MGPCVVIIFQYISNKMQRYTFYFIWKLLYMFRVVPSPIIRRANNCIYSIWYLSHRYCYLELQLQVAVTVWQCATYFTSRYLKCFICCKRLLTTIILHLTEPCLNNSICSSVSGTANCARLFYLIFCQNFIGKNAL